MTSKKLSVCIATYNRAGFIAATLESIIPQVTDEVEIVVVDGASPDNTEEVVLRYAQQCPQLRYVRLEGKGGVDTDYCKAVELAQGSYCWLFTDDDVLKPGSIQAVISAIEQDRYGLIIVNSELRNAELAGCFLPRLLHMRSDRVYSTSLEEQERLLGDVGSYLSFIGCVVIKRQVWNKREKARYMGTEFIHVGVIFQEPFPEEVLVIAEPFVIIRLGNAQWSNRGFRIWLSRWPQLIWSFHAFSTAARRRVCPQYPSQQLRKLFYYRATAAYSRKEYRELVASTPAPFWSRFRAYLIACLPGLLANGVYVWNARLRGRDWMLNDLRASPFYRFGRLKLRRAAREESKQPALPNPGRAE